MNKMLKCTIAVGVVIVLGAATAPAQEAETSQLLWIQEAQVQTSSTAEYETALTELRDVFKKYSLSVPIQIGVSEDLNYGMVVPLRNFAALDSVGQEVEAIAEKSGASGYPAIQRQLGEASTGNNVWLAQTRPDLSYTPENPRLNADEIAFNHYILLYVQSGSEAAVEETLKAFVTLWKKNKIADGFTVAAAVTGSDLPLIVVGVPAKSAADYYARNEEIAAKLGSELEALTIRISANLRRLEVLNITSRPDLSYTPERE